MARDCWGTTNCVHGALYPRRHPYDPATQSPLDRLSLEVTPPG